MGVAQAEIAGIPVLASRSGYTGEDGFEISVAAGQAEALAKTLLALPGRLTRSARRCRLHLPAGWPWAPWFELALARLRCIAYAT